MHADCKRGEGDGGRYLNPADLSTHADALAMLTLHIRSHEIQSAPDEGPWATGTRAQNAQTGHKPDGPGVGEVLVQLGPVQTLRQTRRPGRLLVQCCYFFKGAQFYKETGEKQAHFQQKNGRKTD